jgi:hypothetical protein
MAVIPFPNPLEIHEKSPLSASPARVHRGILS